MLDDNRLPALAAEISRVIVPSNESVSSGQSKQKDTATPQQAHSTTTTPRRVADFLHVGTPIQKLPPELLTRIADLTINRNPEKYAKRPLIQLTHVCHYWRSVILAYPSIWSIISMKPGEPTVVSEWLTRSKNAPLTVIAEFTDTNKHRFCRFLDPVTTILNYSDDDNVCPRHRAALSLNELLPHRSRIRTLNVVVCLSHPPWDSDPFREPTILHHRFFAETLPNVQHLDFRGFHFEDYMPTIYTPGSLFGKELPRLKELKYLGLWGGLIGTATDLTSCEIGDWWRAAGPTLIHLRHFWKLLDNNRNLEALKINECKFFDLTSDPPAPAATVLKDLKYLKLNCPMGRELRRIIHAIHVPQFNDLDTVRVSLDIFQPNVLRVKATDGMGHTFKFSRTITEELDFHPLRHFGAQILTLRLGRRTVISRLHDAPTLSDFFRSLDAVQTFEFNGLTASSAVVVLAAEGMLPALKVIRIAVSQVDCGGTLRLLVPALKTRMEKGNPLTTVEPLAEEGAGGLDPEVLGEWEKCFGEEGISRFLVE